MHTASARPCMLRCLMSCEQVDATLLTWTQSHDCIARLSHFPTSFDGAEDFYCVSVADCDNDMRAIRCAWSGGHELHPDHNQIMWRFFEPKRNAAILRGSASYAPHCIVLAVCLPSTSAFVFCFSFGTAENVLPCWDDRCTGGDICGSRRDLYISSGCSDNRRRAQAKPGLV